MREEAEDGKGGGRGGGSEERKSIEKVRQKGNRKRTVGWECVVHGTPCVGDVRYTAHLV